MKKLTTLFFLIIFSAAANSQTIYVNSDITSNTTWNSSTVDTVRITADINITSGDTLKIIGGVKIIFDQLKTLSVAGTIIANGSLGDTIHFGVSDTTGFSDFRYNPFGGWGGIRSINGKMLFSFCDFSYAKYAIPSDTSFNGELNMTTAYRAGGAIYASNATLSLTNCVIRNCYAYGGSALQCENGCRTSITASKFANNESWNLGTVALLNSGLNRINITDNDFLYNTTLGGGGLFLFLGDSLFVDNCRFYHNKAHRPYSFQVNPNGGVNGAALYLRGFDFSNNLDITISHCDMKYGEADNNGGAIYSAGNVEADIIDNTLSFNSASQNNGGAIFMTADGNFYTTDYHIIRNKITNNSASFGGGIGYYNAATPIFTLEIINNLIANNYSSYDSPGTYGGGGGGGIRLVAGNDSVKILNNTIVNNFSNYMSGGIYILYPRGSNIISGNLIWGNQAQNLYANCESSQIGFFGDLTTTTLDAINYNLIQYGIDSIAILDYTAFQYYSSATYPGIYANNIDQLPNLYAPTSNSNLSQNALLADFSLHGWSPAVNAGNPATSSSQPFMNLDLSLNPRFYAGSSSVIDIGCYEYQGEPTLVSISELSNASNYRGVI